jgi:EAL domain-containing protein (putative c-di-GMP-specific phosphodiesterase class I)
MELSEAIIDIIRNKKIQTYFQPIISLRDGGVLGHEALSRITRNSAIQNTEALFDAAEKYNHQWDLDLLCTTTALQAAFEFMVPPYSNKLFINVCPNIINDAAYRQGFTKSYLAKYGIPTDNLVFEITERYVIKDLNGFLDTVNNYKNQNFKIAIDDAGAGYSGMSLISDVVPDYIKLDMKLIRDINKDKMKYALVKGMIEFSKLTGVHIIAEGIETCDELDTLITLGVQYGQGYYIQRPDAKIEELAVLKKNAKSKG